MDARWRALAVLTAARTSLGVQFQSLASVSPVLVPELGLGWSDLGFLIGLYFLPGVAIALPAGALGARIGDKRAVVLGLVLMVAGGVLVAMAPDRATLIAGRTLSGVGAIVLNVLMSKMVTDWFAGREIVLAMAVFVNSFPIGVGLAMLVLGGLAAAAGWQAGLLAAAAFAAAALALLVFAYAPHPNDRPARRAEGARAAGPPGALDAVLVCTAGAIWGLFNGAFGASFGFAPTFLAGAGLTTAQIGVVTGVATWMLAVSVQVGGLLAQRGSQPVMLMTVGALSWAGALACIAAGVGSPSVLLIASGLLCGLPVGVIMSLPGRILRPEHRAFGMGLFYLWLYVGHGGLPPLAGWLQDRTGSASAPMWLTAAAVALMLPTYLAVEAVLRARNSGRAASTPGAAPTRADAGRG
jgi:MFS family permease